MRDYSILWAIQTYTVSEIGSLHWKYQNAARLLLTVGIICFAEYCAGIQARCDSYAKNPWVRQSENRSYRSLPQGNRSGREMKLHYIGQPDHK